ncbi:MAG: hypothetical protein JXA66_04520, partial [Oligoflexia bacterium]|nr:hypothetical protein [Oligoflexia bacterium]
MEIIGIYFSGILSFLSPCILPVIPVYFATILGNIEQKSRYRVFTAGLFFCIGFTVIFTILGMGAAATGDLIQGNRAIINLVAGIILIILGLHFLRIIIIPVMESSYNIDAAKFRTPFPVLNALIMGIIFGLTWSPCIGPVLGGILTYIASQETGVAGGGIRLMVFGAGISTPLLLFALFTDKITKFIKNNRPFITMLNRLLGLVLVVFAVYLLKDVPAKPQTGNPSPDNANTASHQILKPGKLPLLVAVHSTECSICTEMLPVIRKLQKS